MLIITFHNDGTGNKTVGNYDVKVYINREELWAGRIEGHERKNGWQGLVRRLAEMAKKGK
jgi:hypothetical protein